MRFPVVIVAALLCSTIATARAEDCKTYVDAFNAAPDAAGADEQLYDAGVCYEQNSSLGSAIQMYELLAANYPKAAVTAKAIFRVAGLYARIAWYREAAAKYEEYAKKYAGEADAEMAMREAITFRTGMGEDDKAIADTQSYLKTFGRKRVAEAADVSFRLTTIYERQGDPDKLVAHLQKYIKDYAKAGADRVIVAYAKIGAALWTQSCPVKSVDGSCVKIERQRQTTATFCKTHQAQVTVVERDAKLVKQAHKSLNAAIGAYEKLSGKTGGDDVMARFWYARARFLLADEAFEAYVAVELPTGLDFDPNHAAAAKKSLKRFETWMKEKQKLGDNAATQYTALFEVGDASAMIAASARLGQIPQDYTRALFSIELPKSTAKDATATEAYCDALAGYAEPLQDATLRAFEACLKVSTDLTWSDEWSRLCEYELGQLDPARFPVASELRGDFEAPGGLAELEAPLLSFPDAP